MTIPKFLQTKVSSRLKMRPPKTHISKIPRSSDLYTPAYIKQWSCLKNKELPPVRTIKSISIIDFDNTLFKTPLPNPALWSGPSLGSLSGPGFMLHGGWWHDSRILAATGSGADVEEPRAWQGHWNETIVELVQLASKDSECFTVLLTGRNHKGFPALIQRMIDSKKLQFDMFVPRPDNHPQTGAAIANTLDFKLVFLEELLHTYNQAEKLHIYEDRAPHCISFREFGNQYNEAVCLPVGGDSDKTTNGGQEKRSRQAVVVDVVQVADMRTYLEPLTEIGEVQKMINEHNQVPDRQGPAFKIRKNILFTDIMPIPEREGDMKYLANSILITPRPCPRHIVHRIGGLGAKVDFTVVGFGSWDNQIWAVRVEQSPSDVIIHSDNSPPVIILAHKRSCRPIDVGRINDWQDISSESESRITFTSTIGEKSFLIIEEDESNYIPNSNNNNNNNNSSSPQISYSYSGSGGGLDYDENNAPTSSAYSQVHRGQRKRRADFDQNGHSNNYRGRGNKNNNGQGNGGHRGRGAYRGGSSRGSDREGTNSNREWRSQYSS